MLSKSLFAQKNINKSKNQGSTTLSLIPLTLDPPELNKKAFERINPPKAPLLDGIIIHSIDEKNQLIQKEHCIHDLLMLITLQS